MVNGAGPYSRPKSSNLAKVKQISAEIVIATRKAVNLNRFSADLIIRCYGKVVTKWIKR
jgi:hypothetical protein